MNKTLLKFINRNKHMIVLFYNKNTNMKSFNLKFFNN